MSIFRKLVAGAALLVTLTGCVVDDGGYGHPYGYGHYGHHFGHFDHHGR